MKNDGTFVRNGLAGILVLSLAGCAGGSAHQKIISQLQADIGDLRRLSAEQTSSIGSIQNDFRLLTGRVEQLEFSQERKLNSEVAGLQTELSNIRRRLPPPAVVPEIELEADEVIASRLGDEGGRLFSNALVLIRSSQFQEASDSLERAVQMAEPDQPLVAYFIFWNAVCKDGLGDNKAALNLYFELINRFPKHPRTALALLRQGSVFIRLKDNDTAKLTFKKLIAEFPETTEAARARERLKDLK